MAPRYGTAVFYFVTGFGHQAVVVFFVLSGFFVGGSVIEKRRRWLWRDFLVARVTRLWIVMVPALIFTLLIDAWVRRIDPNALTGIYNEFWHSGPSPGEYSASLLTVIGNVFFTQTILVPVCGSNAPLWSLANEFWYYLLFPALLLPSGVMGNYRSTRDRIAGATLAALILVFLPSSFFVGGLIWLAGVGVWGASRRWEATPFAAVSLAFIAAAAFVLSLLYTKSDAMISKFGLNPDATVGIAFSLLALALAWMPFPGDIAGRALRRGAEHLSQISYSLYLFHFPVVMLLAVGLGIIGTKLVFTTASFLQFLGLLGGLVGLGHGAWFLFERHTDSGRAWVRRHLREVLDSSDGQTAAKER